MLTTQLQLMLFPDPRASEGAGHVEVIAPARRSMRGAAIATIAFLVILAMPFVSAHEPKEYTVLLKDDGPTPNGISSGILVSSDSLFFYNVDKRENVTHRILIDVEGDGDFQGLDDISTPWLSGECQLNETGDRVDPDCQVTSLLLLDPSNGLLPSNISMIHQIDVNGTIQEFLFSVSFSEDTHSEDQDLPTGTSEQNDAKQDGEDLLKTLLLLSLVGMLVLIPRFLASDS